jgi:hypothetical protein
LPPGSVVVVPGTVVVVAPPLPGIVVVVPPLGSVVVVVVDEGVVVVVVGGIVTGGEGGRNMPGLIVEATTFTAGVSVTGVAASLVSESVAEVVSVPLAPPEMSTVAVTPFSDVPAAMEFDVVVHVRMSLLPERAQVHPEIVGAEAKVSPDGRATVIFRPL